MFSNMKAELLLDERHILAEDAFVEVVVWRLPQPTRGSAHGFKYRLALIERGVCALRYDNEAGKGDHRHIGNSETPYRFVSAEKLLADFWRDVSARRK
ncbi:MAG TPA: DUF6516 family protein [Rhizomicrobium sp.]|nr:DUF6516 family protein [Rhizomicrobium sp.]